MLQSAKRRRLCRKKPKSAWGHQMRKIQVIDILNPNVRFPSLCDTSSYLGVNYHDIHRSIVKKQMVESHLFVYDYDY